MKVFRLLPLLIALMLFSAGCGPNEQEQKISQLEASKAEILKDAAANAREIGEAARTLKSKNDDMSASIKQLHEQSIRYEADIETLMTRVERLETTLTQQNANLLKEKDSKDKSSSGGRSIWTLLLIVIIVIVVLYIIVRLIGSGGGYEEEDEDFEDWEDDDDLGFDEEDFGDDDFGDDLSDKNSSEDDDEKK